jgi:ABC-type multidrug transport system permease subunit
MGFMIVDLRVRRLLKLFLATPIRRSDVLVGLVLFRSLMIIPDVLLTIIFGHYVLGVPIRCSYFTLAVVVLAGGLSFAGIGTLLGCRTEKPEAAIGLINLVLMPQVVLSGVFFSYEKFPAVVQPVLRMLPLAQIIDCLREVMLEGKSLDQVAWRFAIIGTYGIICFLLALRWFRWT